MSQIGHTTFVKPSFSKEGWQDGFVAKLGEHTTSMLTDAGVEQAKIKEWFAVGAVAGM